MAKTSVQWVITPSKGIADKLAKATAAMDPALHALAASHAKRAEDSMKQRREWTDRTGHARGSLYGKAEGKDIELGTVNEEYGVFLELGTSRMRAYPVIEPQARETAPEYFDDAGTLVMRLLGGGR